MTSRETLEQLRAEQRIRTGWNPHFDVAPPPIPRGRHADRFRGMMLGLAIGDSLGNTTEGLLPCHRRELCGEIRDYLAHPEYGAGLPSDDTQLAFWTLEQMLEDGRFLPERFAGMLMSRRIFGIGGTVRGSIANLKEQGKPWWEAGLRSAGNGSLMRIAPVLGPHLANPSAELWGDTALCAMITHNDSAAIASCLVFVSMLWDLMGMDAPPPPEWWPETWIARSRGLEIDVDYELRRP